MENTPKVTAKDFFLWAGAMVALYWSIVSFLVLLFEYIDRAFPDVVTTPYLDPYGGSIRFAMASLIVLGPLTVVLLRYIRRSIEAEAGKAEIWVRRWALVFTIFIAGVTVAVDLITLINTFLGGELTTRFVLKVVVVLLVASAAFMHFYADLKGFWKMYPGRAKAVGYAFGLATILTVVAGFWIIGSPSTIRLMRFDDQKVMNLQDIQWQVLSYWQQKRALPADLTTVADPLTGTVIPKDPQTGASYTYAATSPLSFKLCAHFNRPSAESNLPERYAGPLGVLSETWSHGVGDVCFERTIDPARYPAASKNAF